MPILLLLLILVSVAASADTITLVSGKVIEADRAWVEGTQVRYQKDGGIYGVPRALVQKLEQRARPADSPDPDIAKARERLANGDPVEAVRILHVALGRDPQSTAALQAIAEAYLALGDARAAQAAAQKAVRIDPRAARSRAVLGDALAALGDRAGAEEEYRRSLLLHPDGEVQRKLGEVSRPPQASSGGPQFRFRFDGAINEPVGLALYQALASAYAEYTGRLGYAPDDPITVVVQTGSPPHNSRVPYWAEGINDGSIHVPVRGLDSVNPRIVSVLRHELAHSFVASRTGGNCPTWLHEGIAQWLEGGDPSREDSGLRSAARASRLIPLISLEGPFQDLSEADATLAYAQSLSVVAYLLRTRGEDGIRRLLAALGDRIPSEEALPVAVGLSYAELQQAWQAELHKGNGPRNGTAPVQRD
jgi:tetratricopeptide (TPR) repeat protein